MSALLIGMSKVKADDMDEMGQSGAANLLRMNVAEIERLEGALQDAIHCLDANRTPSKKALEKALNKEQDG